MSASDRRSRNASVLRNSWSSCSIAANSVTGASSFLPSRVTLVAFIAFYYPEPLSWLEGFLLLGWTSSCTLAVLLGNQARGDAGATTIELHVNRGLLKAFDELVRRPFFKPSAVLGRVWHICFEHRQHVPINDPLVPPEPTLLVVGVVLPNGSSTLKNRCDLVRCLNELLVFDLPPHP